MADEQIVTTPTDEGVANLLASQDSGEQVQGQTQNQESVSGQVETTAPSVSSGEERRKPSYFYEQRDMKKNIRAMQEKIDFLVDKLNTPLNPTPQNTQEDQNVRVWQKPIEVMNELINQSLQKLVPQSLKQELGQHEYNRELQEAKELIFQNGDIKKDPEGFDKIADILKKYGLDMVGATSPMKAASAALEIYKLQAGIKGQRNPNAPTKGQMSSTGSAITANANRIPTMDDVKRLTQKLIDNPELANDENFTKELQALKARLSQT